MSLPWSAVDLQCGRIYKDAEIYVGYGAGAGSLFTFNVAASIKMRKFIVADLDKSEILAFNVAASIKMRKSPQIRQSTVKRPILQCGRIYKDAEIRNRFSLAIEAAAFNVAASIKMRKLCAVPQSRAGIAIAFNVAASIKMRKSPGYRRGVRHYVRPSMWPHL